MGDFQAYVVRRIAESTIIAVMWTRLDQHEQIPSAVKFRVKAKGKPENIDKYNVQSWFDFIRRIERTHSGRNYVYIGRSALGFAMLQFMHQHYLSSSTPITSKVEIEFPLFPSPSGVEEAILELGLQLVEVKGGHGDKVYQSTARKGFMFSVKYINVDYDLGTYYAIKMRIVEDKSY